MWKSRSASGRLRGTEGFTLIELLVSITIISILLGIAVASAPANRREFLLSTSQQQLQGLLTRARALSINSVAYQGSMPAGQQCGYGVHVSASPSNAFIFYACGALPFITTYNSSASAMGGTLNSMTLDKSLQFASSSNIFFLPPDPAVYIDGSTSTNSIVLNIVSIDNQEARGVEVNAAGLIDLTYNPPPH
jgi:prepilin-type N-terminal cleavage/methylation domain-containing protein